MSHISDPKVWSDFVSKQMQNPEFAAAYSAARAEFNLGLALARAREERRFTQRELAERSGVKQPMIARIEKGQMPNVWTLAKIAMALNAAVTITPDGQTAISLAP
jgi:DNA-binding XRE family transcriptional regulator